MADTTVTVIHLAIGGTTAGTVVTMAGITTKTGTMTTGTIMTDAHTGTGITIGHTTAATTIGDHIIVIAITGGRRGWEPHCKARL
jgi:hypothetical protein